MSKRVRFGRVPYEIIDTGWLARLKLASDLRVYLVLAAHVNARTWTAYPSIERIARLTDVSEKTVRRSLGRLCVAGFIRIKKGGGRGRSNQYTLITRTENTDTLDDSVSEGETRTPCVSGFEVKNPDKTEPTTGHPGPETLSSVPRNPVIMNGRLTEEQDQQKQQSESVRTAAAQLVIEELHRYGIDPPTDRILIDECAGMTRDLIREALEGVSPNGRVGCRVILLRDRMPALLIREAGRHRLAEWLRTLEPGLVARYEAESVEIDVRMQALVGSGPEDLEGSIVCAIARKLRDDSECCGLVDQIGGKGVLWKEIARWRSSSTRSGLVYKFMGFAILQQNEERDAGGHIGPRVSR